MIATPSMCHYCLFMVSQCPAEGQQRLSNVLWNKILYFYFCCFLLVFSCVYVCLCWLLFVSYSVTSRQPLYTSLTHKYNMSFCALAASARLVEKLLFVQENLCVCVCVCAFCIFVFFDEILWKYYRCSLNAENDNSNAWAIIDSDSVLWLCYSLVHYHSACLRDNTAVLTQIYLYNTVKRVAISCFLRRKYYWRIGYCARSAEHLYCLVKVLVSIFVWHVHCTGESISEWWIGVHRPLGETMTGSLRRTSASVDSVSDMTSTVPRLVPTHRHGHVDSSVHNQPTQPQLTNNLLILLLHIGQRQQFNSQAAHWMSMRYKMTRIAFPSMRQIALMRNKEGQRRLLKLSIS